LADYARVLARPRYQPAREVTQDPFAFAKALQRCGYATDPRYAAKLSALVRKHDLTQYDLSKETNHET
jgi:flagellar protein FlgJ